MARRRRVRRSASGENSAMPFSASFVARNLSMGCAGFAFGGATLATGCHAQWRSSSSVNMASFGLSGSGRAVFAPCSIHVLRTAFCTGETFLCPIGISSDSTRFQSRLSPGLPGAISGPSAPPLSIILTVRRSSLPFGFGSSPWHWKQCCLRIGRTSFSNFSGASAPRSNGAKSKRATTAEHRKDMPDLGGEKKTAGGFHCQL